MRSFKLLVRTVPALAGAWLLASCDIPQPKMDCAVGLGGWAAQYTLKAATTCPVIKGEVIGLRKYFSSPAAEKVTLAIRTQTQGDLEVLASSCEGVADTTPGNSLSAIGEFSAHQPAEDGFCTVPSLSPARLSLPAFVGVPASDSCPGTEPTPASAITYDWSDVRILTRPDAPGSQLTANLKRTVNGCAADYKVVAVWPHVPCQNEAGEADAALCKGLEPVYANSLAPNVPVRCDPDLFICLLDGEPPALK